MKDLNQYIEAVINEKLALKTSRRQFLKSSAVAATAFSAPLGLSKEEPFKGKDGDFAFNEIPHSLDDQLHVPQGYKAEGVISWGDSLDQHPGMDIKAPTQQAQAKSFGFNNDFIAYLPIKGSSAHGLLCVNHEYASPHMMFHGYRDKKEGWKKATDDHLAIMQHAVGHTVIEIIKKENQWTVVRPSKYNRRIDLLTDMVLSGPAAGHRRMRSLESPEGIKTRGTMGNCAGGKTPWATLLTAEENFGRYFSGDKLPEGERSNYQAYQPAPKSAATWAKIDQRFDLEQDPMSFNHFGWMVEINPFAPNEAPRKLTALGRFQHEGASIVAHKGEPIVVYMGDDGKNECIYKFVSSNRYQGIKDPSLLDEGILYVAAFLPKGQLQWLPLVYGQEPLNKAHGFHSQADVLIETRRAAKLVGGTPMDRPEDIEVNPQTGKVYAMLTNNTQRKTSDSSNPRSPNRFGHILELQPVNGRHSETDFKWDILIMAGDPAKKVGAWFHSQTSESGWFCCPDNVAFHPQGSMWVATDGCEKFGFCDGLWQVETTGRQRGLAKHFLSCPLGAELCGPEFTPDGKTLFVAIQHPGDSEGSNFEKPSSRWPHFQNTLPPLPSIVAISKR